MCIGLQKFNLNSQRDQVTTLPSEISPSHPSPSQCPTPENVGKDKAYLGGVLALPLLGFLDDALIVKGLRPLRNLRVECAVHQFHLDLLFLRLLHFNLLLPQALLLLLIKAIRVKFLTFGNQPGRKLLFAVFLCRLPLFLRARSWLLCLRALLLCLLNYILNVNQQRATAARVRIRALCLRGLLFLGGLIRVALLLKSGMRRGRSV